MRKRVLITGATGGIGQAICRELAKEGYDIIIHYSSNEAKARELSEEIKEYKAGCEIFRADLSDPQQIRALAEKAGDTDVLVNNAGVSYQTVFQCADSRRVKELFDINLMGAIELTKEILPSMIRRQKGRIINISSMWGICGASCEVHYSASKAGLIGFTKALAKEVGPSGITVNCVAPGFIDTPMNKSIDREAVKEIIEATPVGRAGRGEDVASLVAFLAGDKAEFITGQIISVDGGFAV